MAAAVRARIAADLARARAILSSGSARAAEALVDMAAGTAAPDAARATSASRVLDHATKMHELVELESRIAALESSEGNHG
jgi:thioredoxin-like negative regulator of GroEL